MPVTSDALGDNHKTVPEPAALAATDLRVVLTDGAPADTVTRLWPCLTEPERARCVT